MYVMQGKISYGEVWCVAWIDSQIADYYYSLIPKYYYANVPLYKGHVTIVSKYDNPDLSLWKKHEGKAVNIQYEPLIQQFGKYFGITCYSKDLEDIRTELGLTPLMGGNIQFHLTIGNTK